MSSLLEVEQYYWWHSIDLGDGVITPGAKTLESMKLEGDILFNQVDLNGKSFLDVGAWNGGFSAEALRRGASSISGVDHATWNNPELRGRETFELVSEAVNGNFRAFDIDLDEPRLSMSHLGQFDVVLFSGVFYHLVDPIAATREVAGLARETLIVETHVENTEEDRPMMVFYPGTELNNDGSNWWGPNPACVIALLKHFGFARVNVSGGSSDMRRVFHAYRY